MCSGNETANIYFWSHLLNQRNLELVTGLLPYLWLQSWRLWRVHACLEKYACIPARDTPHPTIPSPLLDKLKFWWNDEESTQLSTQLRLYSNSEPLYEHLRSDTEPQQCSQVQMLSSFLVQTLAPWTLTA